MGISAKTKICIIIGDPVEHSLSPAMHNFGYKSLGIESDYVYVAANVKISEIENAVTAMRTMNFRGLTCTMPHKLEVVKYLDSIDSIAQKIGAVNTVVNENGVLRGYNTDWLGVVLPLEKIRPLTGANILLFGAGGAARAAAYGVIKRGAKLTIVNRTIAKAHKLVQHLGENAIANTLEEVEKKIDEFDIIINTTQLGMGKYIDKTPLKKALISPKHIVFDAIYDPLETKLLMQAREKGAVAIGGIEMLIYQGIAQFELYTGKKVSENVFRKVVYKLLKHQ